VTPAAPEIRRHTSPEELAEQVAATLITTLAHIQAQGGVPSVVLTGGTIARSIHRAVADAPDVGRVDWSRVDIWFGDERFVPSGDPDRNLGQAAEDLLDRLPFDPARVHPMPASDADGSSGGVAEAAAAYADELRTRHTGAFDVVMLSLGPDGHVASLFPGFPALDVRDTEAVAVTDSPKPPPERISLTFSTLNHAQEVWFLVSGEAKAETAARALATGDAAADVRDLPAVGVHGRERTVWFLDEAAASAL
jgi:6-phosphogluconolactonase